MAIIIFQILIDNLLILFSIIRCANDCVCAFAVHEVQVKEVMSVADNSLIMPPKSTWFEPKPRSGGVIRVFKN